jgi:uncharacterized delta-60 repeat protein
LANAFPNGIHVVKVHEGNLVLGGFVSTGNDGVLKFLKATPNGVVDPTFPTINATLSLNEGTIPTPIISVSGATILITGNFTVPSRGIMKTDGTGVINQGFNHTVSGPATVSTVKKLANGKILIGGKFTRVGNVVANNLALLNTDGTIDTDFASNLGTGFDRPVECVAELANGKLMIGGQFLKLNSVDQRILVRLNADGSLDNTFVHPLGGLFLGRGVETMHLFASGELLVGGGFYVQSGFHLAKLSANGSLVPGFSIQTLEQKQLVTELAVQSDENILVTGAYFSSEPYLYKLTKDGIKVSGFTTPDLTSTIPSTLKVLRDDSFLLSATKFGNSVTFPIMRFSKEGALIDGTSLQTDSPVDFIEQLEGDNLLIAGSFTKMNGKDIRALAKVKLNGAVEDLFNYCISGSVSTLYKDSSPNGHWYVGGSFKSVLQQPVFNLAKLDLEAIIRPSDLSASKDKVNGTITLTWIDRSATESGFRILRSEASTFAEVGTVGENVTSFKDNTTVPQKNYQYKIVAYSATRESDPSNALSVSTTDWLPPATPQNFAFDISDNYKTVALTWTNVDDETSFELERSINEASFSKLAAIEKDVLTHTDDFVFETSVRYRLRAVNKFGNSEYTSIAQIPVLMGTEDSSDPLISIYPNPTVNRITISLRDGSQAAQGTLVNSEGKKMHTFQVESAETDIDLSGMPRGVYYLKLLHGKGIKVVKLVRN